MTKKKKRRFMTTRIPNLAGQFPAGMDGKSKVGLARQKKNTQK